MVESTTIMLHIYVHINIYHAELLFVCRYTVEEESYSSDQVDAEARWGRTIKVPSSM